jgi:hypothetical protein
MTQASSISGEDRLYSAIPELVRRLRDDPFYAGISNSLSISDARRRGAKVREVAEEIARYWEIEPTLLLNTCAQMLGENRGISNREDARQAFVSEVFEERVERAQAPTP